MSLAFRNWGMGGEVEGGLTSRSCDGQVERHMAGVALSTCGPKSLKVGHAGDEVSDRVP